MKKEENFIAFRRGFEQLPLAETKAVKAEIMSALGVTSRPGWTARLNGTVEPRLSEARRIEAIFAKRGITDVWCTPVINNQ